MRIVSWNVNGLRACAGKGFLDALARSKADVLGVQEVRAFEHQLPDAVRAPKGWHTHFVAAERAGYSGVGLFSRSAPDRVEDSLGEPRFDIEGRYQLARFGKVVVVNAYFPKGSGKDRDNSRVPYKLDFYRAVFDRVQRLRRRYRVFVIGDWNTAHNEIDLARPAGNRHSSGFLPEERAEMDRWMAAGWVDTFRKLNPGAAGHYSWWRQWGGARERNVGWRIDYVVASPGAMRRVRDAFIWPDMTGSDHCPVGVDVEGLRACRKRPPIPDVRAAGRERRLDGALHSMSKRDHTSEKPEGQADSGSKLVELRGHEERMHALRNRRIDLEVERIVAATEQRTERTGAGAEVPGSAASSVIDALDRLRNLESGRAARLALAGAGNDSTEDLLKRLQAGTDALGAWLDADRAPADSRGMRIAKLGLLLACLAIVALAAAFHIAFLVLLVPVGGAMSFLLWTGQDRAWRRMGARRKFESLRLERPSAWTEGAVRMRLRALSLAAEGLRRRATRGGKDDEEGNATIGPDDLEAARSELREALAEAGLHGDSVDESTETRLRATARVWRADRALRGVAEDMSGERAGADAIRESIYRDLSRAGAAPPDGDASVDALEAGADRIRRR